MKSGVQTSAHHVADAFSVEAVNRMLTRYYGGRYDEAIKGFQRCLELDPEFSLAHLVLSGCFAVKGLPQIAFEELEKAAGFAIPTEAGPGIILALSGHADEARKLLARFKAGPNAGITAFFLGWAYAAIGDNDEAMRWLEEAYRQRTAILPTIAFRPGTESLRSDRRFHDLMRRIGL